MKCHLVGEFNPPGSERAKGPQLEQVHDRLRPDYVHRWVGNPKRILPYTGMPVNIPYDKGVAQSLFPGDSSQQLDGVVDLLMNWDRFTMERFSIKPWIKPAAGAAAAQRRRRWHTTAIRNTEMINRITIAVFTVLFVAAAARLKSGAH